jgi:hydrogenase maturation protease
MTTRLVVLGWGNPSRGDDALGPEFLARAELLAQHAPCDIEFVTDFQLQPEHSSDLLGRDLALFVDASTTAPTPFLFSAVAPTRDRTFTSHAMSPGALLSACADAFSSPLPAGFLLAIRGDRFELGDGLSLAAHANLGRAVAFFETLVRHASPDRWSAAARECAAGRHPA